MSYSILWFRNDLRIHDNEALQKASDYDRVLPVFIFDHRWFAETSFGFPKTAAHRCRFLIETVQNLRSSLQNIGSNLIVRIGNTENELEKLINQTNAEVVIAAKEVTDEEIKVEQAVDRTVDVPLNLVWGSTLFHPDDIPYEPANIPKTFTNFRKQVEKKSDVRSLFSTPNSLPSVQGIESGKIPAVEELILEQSVRDERSVLSFVGGEDAALERLENYFWNQDKLKNYKFTRNGLLGGDYSSKFSPWLANGALSPRRIYWEVKKYEERRKQNVSTYWMIFELIWRDFFRFSAIRYGNDMFKAGGIQQKDRQWRYNRADFDRWANGQIGIPFIDANMRELNKTGFMSNRGRQNVASFLAQNLNIDWRMGAQYFESKLIDYDVCSNYGNWMYNATVGQDPRNRYFNIVKQAKKYDSKGEYVRHWLSELKEVPQEFIHQPHTMAVEQQKLAGVDIGSDYPEPMIDLEASYKEIRNRG